MPGQFKLETLESFTGGLNFRTDQFNLEENESPDLLNVLVDPRGGIRMRDGVDRRNTTALSADVQGIWALHTDSGTNQLMVNYSTKVAYSATSNFTDVTGITSRTDGSRVYGMTMNNVAYGVSYDQVSFKWDGSSAADLGVTLDGSAGNFPQAQYVAFWNNFAWAAYTYESGAGYKYRVRWSNANDPEKWSSTDFVDIDKGEHGDYITGLCPMGDRLLVFKSNSVYAISGSIRTRSRWSLSPTVSDRFHCLLPCRPPTGCSSGMPTRVSSPTTRKTSLGLSTRFRRPSTTGALHSHRIHNWRGATRRCTSVSTGRRPA